MSEQLPPEKCERCDEEIIEQAFIFDEQIVCQPCYRLLHKAKFRRDAAASEMPQPANNQVVAVPILEGTRRPRAITFIDRAGPFGIPPRKPFLSVGKVENVAMLKLKIITIDPDSSEIGTILIGVPDGTSLEAVADYCRREGLVMREAIIIDRYWEQKETVSNAAKSLLAFGFFETFR